MRIHSRVMAIAGLLAGPWFAAVLLVLAPSLPGYRHALHPPALLGAVGMPAAGAFNLFGFVVAGLLAALALHAVYGALRAAGAGFLARIGATVMLLSAVAFTALGLFPLDIDQPIDLGPSRLHIAVWNLWWLAAALGAALTAVAVPRLTGWRSLLPAGVALLLLVPGALNTGFGGLEAGWRQRVALAAWFGWVAWASWLALRPRLSRNAA